jgi:hypothetical protein
MAKCDIYSKKRTQRDRNKKLYTQMTNAELRFLVNELNKLQSFETTFHADDKFRQLELNVNMVKELIGKFDIENIIEYNTGRGDKERRVVIKDARPIKCDNGKEVVAKYSIDLDTGVIVTVWVNLTTDTHKTIDMSYYNKDLKII